MAKKKKHEYKKLDIVEYGALGYNPYVIDESTMDKMKDNYDVAMVDHRKRLAKQLARKKATEEMAARLGVEFKPKLTPVREILDILEKED